MRLLSAALIAAASLPTVAQAADQFDLVCTGGVDRTGSGRTAPTSAHYRVDLAARLWCEGACEKVSSIQDVTPAKITFRSTDTARVDGITREHYVSRIDGKWYRLDYARSPAPYDSFAQTTGTCEPAPFSGLPSARF